MVVVPDGIDDEDLDDGQGQTRQNSALIAATAAAAVVMSLSQGSGRAGSTPRKRTGHAVNGITKRSNSGTGRGGSSAPVPGGSPINRRGRNPNSRDPTFIPSKDPSTELEIEQLRVALQRSEMRTQEHSENSRQHELQCSQLKRSFSLSQAQVRHHVDQVRAADMRIDELDRFRNLSELRRPILPINLPRKPRLLVPRQKLWHSSVPATKLK